MMNLSRIIQIVKDYIRHFMKDTKEIHFFGICTQMSFYMMMVFFPLFIFLMNFVGAFAGEHRNLIIDTLVSYMPDLSAEYVQDMLMRFNFDHPENHLPLLAFSFVFSVLGFRNIIRGLNHSHQTYRQTFSHRALLLRSAVFMFVFNISVLVMIVTLLFGSDMVQRILSSLPLQTSLPVWIGQNLFVFNFLISLMLFSGIYYIVSIDKLSFKHTLPGALLCTLGFNVGLRVLIYFTNRSGQYIQVYGHYAGLFVLLVMIYWYALLLNVGANMNAYYAKTFKGS